MMVYFKDLLVFDENKYKSDIDEVDFKDIEFKRPATYPIVLSCSGSIEPVVGYIAGDIKRDTNGLWSAYGEVRCEYFNNLRASGLLKIIKKSNGEYVIREFRIMTVNHEK